jgi:hypothetical protein
MDKEPPVEEPLLRPGGPYRGRAWRISAALAHWSGWFRGENDEAGLLFPAAGQLPFARVYPPLQRLHRIYWNRCSFCPEKTEANPYLPIPVQQVISDLTDLEESTNPVLIHLLDNAVSPALLDALSSGNTSAPWYGFARIEHHLTDYDFSVALKRAGCVMLKLGIESGDQGVLDRQEKGIRLETASAVLKNLKRAGIATYIYLIFGTPEETETGAQKTLEFIVRHSTSIDFLNLAIFNMPVCSGSPTGIERKGFYEGDLSLYTDFIHPHGWNRKRVRLFLEHEFRRHPAVSPILNNEPPVFTSNHAPFFVKG